MSINLLTLAFIDFNLNFKYRNPERLNNDVSLFQVT